MDGHKEEVRWSVKSILCSLDWAGPPQYLTMFGVFESTFAWVIVCQKSSHLFLSAFSLVLSLSLSLPCALSRSFSLSRSWPLRRLWSRSRLRLLRPPRLLLPDLLWRERKGGKKLWVAFSSSLNVHEAWRSEPLIFFAKVKKRLQHLAYWMMGWTHKLAVINSHYSISAFIWTATAKETTCWSFSYIKKCKNFLWSI